MGDKLSRRDVLIAAAGAAAAWALAGCGKSAEKTQVEQGRSPRNPAAAKLVVGSAKDPADATRAAVTAIGGMAAFVKKGDFVVLKPNIAWARPADAAATTHPDVITAVIEMCKDAGAGDILVIDHVIDRPSDMVLSITGIKSAAEKAGARVVAAQNESMFSTIEVPQGKSLTKDQVLKDVLKADVFINMPKAKTHGETKLTLGMKNLMGIIWNRQRWHAGDLHQYIADLAGAVKPDLVIMDATRILVTNGPKGPGDTKDVGQVIAGTDQVAVDSCAALLFGMKPEDVDHIRLAHQAGLGEIDFKKVMAK